MIPNIDILEEEIVELEYPNKTYKINANSDTEDSVIGHVDDLDAIKQSAYLMLNVERYEYPIYSWDYGVELVDLIGQPMPYVMSEVSRRIDEALTQDERIESTKDYEFERVKDKLHVTFTIVTSLGDISTELEVNV